MEDASTPSALFVRDDYVSYLTVVNTHYCNPNFVYQIGKHLYYPNKHCLLNTETGVIKHLRRKYWEILNDLCLSEDGYRSHQYLLTTIFGYNENAKTQTLRTHISGLRKILEEQKQDLNAYLMTSTNGYCLKITAAGIHN